MSWNKTDHQLSPYLRDPTRLGDVVAAIQAMAVYKFYKLPFVGWADRIAADESQADKWKTVFLEHPEFFRLDTAREKASLVWRRQFPKRYDVDGERVLTIAEYEALTSAQKLRVSRVPLSSGDIKALVGRLSKCCRRSYWVCHRNVIKVATSFKPSLQRTKLPGQT